MINPLGIVLTILVFKGSELLKRYPFINKIPPVFITGLSIIMILKLFNIDFETYNETAKWLTYLLIPATIALGYPLYKNINILKRNKRVIFFAFIFASICALITTYTTAKLCNTEPIILASMLPKSVTAPIAIEISKNIGGIPELTACVVVLTGLLGALLGHKILKLIRIKNDIAIGLSMGATSHIIATSRCIETGRKKQVVMSTIALIAVGIITSIFAPIFVLMIK